MNIEKSKNKNSYGQILKSSSIMGGAAGITLLIGIVRTKFVAVLIGTGGVGLLASFTAIQGLWGTVAGLGLASSAVKDVAAAVAKGDQQAIGRTVLTLRRMSWLTGLLGMGSLMAISPLVGQFTFGSDKHNLEIAALGLIILFSNITGGQTALIQGTRRIGDIARLQIIGAAVGTVVAIGFYIWLALRGIIPALVLTSAIQLLVSWRYAQRVAVPKVEMTWGDSFQEASGMMKLGVAMMWTGLVTGLVTYATVVMITDQFDLQSVGLYSAAFALSGMFVNFVLQAMGTDFFPRLTSVSHDKDAMNRLVNEQTEIGILLVTPGILAMLILAPWIIQLFYTKEFLPAVDLLQWFILGCFGTVVSWPMGFMMISLGKGLLYFMVESFWNALHLGLVVIGMLFFGLEGAAMAFFVFHIFVVLSAYMIAQQLSCFSWSTQTIRLILLLLFIAAVAFIAARTLPIWPATIFGMVLIAVTTVFSIRGLVGRIGYEHRLVRAVCKITRMCNR